MSVKTIKSMLIGSPMVVIQLALFIYMTVYGIQATFRVFSSPFLQWSYAIYIVYVLVLAVTALLKTYMTEPGNVTAALIEKLKNQMLTAV